MFSVSDIMIMRCNCGYTLKMVCERCGKTRSAHPPKFSQSDRYAKYRRLAKEKNNISS